MMFQYIRFLITAGPDLASMAGQPGLSGYWNGFRTKKYLAYNFVLLCKTTYQTLLKTLPILRRLANGI